MLGMHISRMRIGRPPDAEDVGQSHAGTWIWVFKDPRDGVACAGRQSQGQREGNISACGEKGSPSPWSSPPRRGDNIR